MSQGEFAELVRRANAGEERAVSDLRAILHDRPQVWRRLADLSQHAELALIRAIAGKNKLLATSLENKLAELRSELLGSNPSTLEKLLVGRVVVSFLEVEFATMKFPADEAANLPTAKFAIQLKAGAQRRFDAAVKSLLLVRERLPAIERANRQLQKERRKIIRLPKRVSA